MPGETILVIDDSPADLDLTREILEAEGYTIVVHESAFGATAVVMEAMPALILMDVDMPGLRGESLAEIVKSYEEISSIPILFYSSHDEHYLRRTAQLCGAAGYVCKGNPSDLRIKIRGVLSGLL